MVDTYAFQPLIGVGDFEAAVECYDQHLRHPADGPSFTEHFAPKAWAAGYQLASDCGTIYGRIAKARGDNGLPDSHGMTMQGFTTLMNYILIHLLPNLGAGQSLNPEDIDAAIVSTNCMIFEQQEALLAVP